MARILMHSHAAGLSFFDFGDFLYLIFCLFSFLLMVRRFDFISKLGVKLVVDDFIFIPFKGMVEVRLKSPH